MARLRVVADTGPLVSAGDSTDRAHPLASALLAEAGPELLVPDVVVNEVDYLLRRRASPAAARVFLQDLAADTLRRVSVDHTLFERAVLYDSTFADLDLGIVDASVMALAERERAIVLTWDFGDFRATRPLRGGFWRLAIDEERFRKAIRE